MPAAAAARAAASSPSGQNSPAARSGRPSPAATGGGRTVRGSGRAPWCRRAGGAERQSPNAASLRRRVRSSSAPPSTKSKIGRGRTRRAEAPQLGRARRAGAPKASRPSPAPRLCGVGSSRPRAAQPCRPACDAPGRGARSPRRQAGEGHSLADRRHRRRRARRQLRRASGPGRQRGDPGGCVGGPCRGHSTAWPARARRAGRWSSCACRRRCPRSRRAGRIWRW